MPGRPEPPRAERQRSPLWRLAGAALVVSSASCGAPEVANVPPEVLDDCRREVALIRERDPAVSGAESVPGEAGEPTDEVLDDARTAREEAARVGIAGWPEDVLLYRCLASRGVELSPEQARALAEWEAGGREE